MTIAPRPLGHGFGREPSAPGAAARDASPQGAPTRDAPADRLHNREEPSASEMAEMLREIQDALGVVDERLEGLQGAQGASALVTRRLAANVAEMGEALARRMRSLESREATSEPVPSAQRPAPSQLSRASAPRRPQNRLAMSVVMAVVLGAILAGFWLFGQGRTHRALAAKPAPRAAAIADRPVAAAPAAIQTATAPHPSFTPRPRSARRPVTPRATPTGPSDAGPPTSGFGSFGPAVTANSAPKPPG